MGTYRGNVDKLREDIDRIVERLRQSSIPITTLYRTEYHVGYATFKREILKRISEEEYQHIAKQRMAQLNNEATQFKKGHTPWNKDVKGLRMSPATEFKKGHLPHNYKKIGAIYIVKDKKGTPYRWIKLKDTGPREHRRKPYARYVWEGEHGPIPKGGIIRHKDGDSLNDNLDNLMLIDRAENARITRRSPKAEANRLKALRKAAKKRWRAYRKKKKEQAEALESLRQKRLKAVAEEVRDKELHEENIIQIRGPLTVWYDCPGCGYRAKEEALPCPKCGSIVRFERIEHAMEYIENWNEMRDGARPARKAACS